MTDSGRMVVWLRAAMDAAMQRAQAAATEAGGADWEYQDHDNRLVATSPPRFAVADVDYLDPAPGQFMADNDPAAVLRRIAADRKLLDDLERIVKGDYIDDGELPLAESVIRDIAEGYGWTETPPKPDWPECMCTPSGECGKCWEKRQGAA